MPTRNDHLSHFRSLRGSYWGEGKANAMALGIEPLIAEGDEHYWIEPLNAKTLRVHTESVAAFGFRPTWRRRER